MNKLLLVPDEGEKSSPVRRYKKVSFTRNTKKNTKKRTGNEKSFYCVYIDVFCGIPLHFVGCHIMATSQEEGDFLVRPCMEEPRTEIDIGRTILVWY